MHLESPWFWAALPLLLAWVWWNARRSYAQLSPSARVGSTAIRAVVLVCLLAALSRPILDRATSGQHLYFLLDVSRSIGKENLSAGIAEIERLASEPSGGKHRITVIGFGRQPRILVNAAKSWNGLEQSIREQLLHETSLPELNSEAAKLLAAAAPEEEVRRLRSRIDAVQEFQNAVAGDHTDAAAALRLALSSGELHEAKTIFLLTDANFTRGEWRDAIASAASQGHDIRAIALDKQTPPEAAAVDLTLPRSVRINQGFTADLRIASTVEGAAKVVLYKDGVSAGEFPLTLKAGDNTLPIPGLYFRDKGFHTIEAVVRAERDTRVENNSVRSLAIVPGELRVLYVDSEEAQQSYLTSALALEGIQVDARPASGVPQSLTELLNYDTFILSNTPADRLSQRQMQMIRAYVQEFGGGFIMLGGDQSFGLGGYFGTPVEEVLPVRMPIQKELNRPSLAIILVIDKSGSMEGVKIQLAKRAAIATGDAINPRDQIGVVGFDSDARTILELTPAGDKATISAQIGTLEAGGGTFLYPALEIAHEQLQGSNARKKHIIILSDGQTQGFGYADIAQMMASEGITVSTVGIGEGADMRLMEEIAGAGAGRSYFTDDFYSIPQIFTREALRASNSMLVERLVIPTSIDDDESLKEIDAEELPPLAGYVATTPREAAKTIIISDSGDPILAKWRTGLGRAAAFTSDTKLRWAEDWIRWPEFAKFWAQLVRSVAGQDVSQELSLELAQEVRGDRVRLTADIRTAAGDFVSGAAPELAQHDPQSGTSRVAVDPEAPGLFAATVPLGNYGKTQQFAWKLADEREPLVVPFGFIHSYSPEFRTLGPSRETLAELAERCGRPATSVGSTPLELSTRTSLRRISLWPYLLSCALLLAPLDILRRRLS
jgi:Ca-activated chloride channel family protein